MPRGSLTWGQKDEEEFAKQRASRGQRNRKAPSTVRERLTGTQEKGEDWHFGVK